MAPTTWGWWFYLCTHKKTWSQLWCSLHGSKALALPNLSKRATMRKPHADEYISYRYINIPRGVPVALFLTSCFGICEILEPSKPKRSENAFYICTSHLFEPQKEAFSAWDGTKIVIMSESAKKNERKIGCMGQNNRKTPSFCFVNTLSVLPDYQYTLKIYAHANL